LCQWAIPTLLQRLMKKPVFLRTICYEKVGDETAGESMEMKCPTNNQHRAPTQPNEQRIFLPAAGNGKAVSPLHFLTDLHQLSFPITVLHSQHICWIMEKVRQHNQWLDNVLLGNWLENRSIVMERSDADRRPLT
jgi:hypothetical protein